MNEPSQPTIAFEEFEIDTFHRRLLRRGEPVVLTAKAFDVLAFLVENNGRVVGKDEILDSVWGDRFVEESNLVVQISNLRRVLGESRNSPRFLATIPGKGYKFAATIDQNSFVVETHTVSELTIEQSQEIVSDRVSLMRRPAVSWRGLAAVGMIVVLAILAMGFWRYQLSKKDSQVAAWADVSRRAIPKQLTAVGNVDVAAISPDGTLFAYTNEGSATSGLWVAGVNGSKIVEILAPSETDFEGLTFSPDGLFIYYVARGVTNKENALFRVPTMGGLPEQILSNVCCAPTFSPDGSEFAFARHDSQNNLSSIVAGTTRGETTLREIASRPAETRFNANGASWSPDGTKIAIGARYDNDQGNGVVLVDVGTGSVERFGKKAWNFVRRVEWLPDGSGLIANVIEKESSDVRQIWMIEYPSGESHKITNDSNQYGREIVSVSANGTKILGVRDQLTSDISVGDTAGRANLTQITNHPVGRGDGFHSSLSWMPDDRLLYVQFFDNNRSLWTMNPDGSGTKQLSQPNSNLRHPMSTPDGRYIVFHSFFGNSNIWRMNSDGSQVKQLTFSGGSMPDITPDGQWVFFEDGGFIWKVPIEGGEPSRMTAKSSKSVSVSPDGTMFACFYRLSNDDKLKLAVFPIAGGEPLYLFDVPVDLLYPKLDWTPDGKALIYAFYSPIVWKQSLAGGDPEKFLEFSGEVVNAFAWSFDGGQFAVAHGQEIRDVVLFSVNN